MKKSIFIVLMLAIAPAGIHAENYPAQAITPHEERCPLCGAYGYCEQQPSLREAAKALKSYYAKKGMKATVVKQDGRFIEANVIKNSKIIDRVLLDCRTGRIRSIY
ncbi:MAG TPA: hypothetical protein DHV16_12130 [Nitrospiraceae bacterium]|nr:hypothetical protein [Nitrospiraceae bacterium]